MPGELGNCIAGRVANLFNLHGPNFVVDAACASAMAAMDARSRAWSTREYDTVAHRRRRPQHGGVDIRQVLRDRRAVGAPARGRTPTAPTASSWARAPRLFVLKRLADAERDGDRIYAVRARHRRLERRQGQGHHRAQPGRPAARRSSAPGATAGCRPAACSMIEGHGTSTARRRRRRAVQPRPRRSRRGPRPRLGRARLGEVQHRPPEGRGRRRRPAQGGPRAAPQGAAAEPRLRAARTPTSTGRRRRSPSTPSCATGRSPTDASARRRRERVRLRRDQLPRRARGVRARPSDDGNGHRASIAVPTPRCRPRPPRRGTPRRRARAGPPAARRAARRRAATRGSPSCCVAEPRPVATPAPRRRRRPRAPERLAIDYARRRRARAKAEAGAAALSPATRRSGRRCAGAASSAAAARRARSRSSTPARARSTRTCSHDLRAHEPVVADHVRRGRRDHVAAARGPAAVRHHLHDGPRGRRRAEQQLCAPRSRSPRC